MGDRPSDSDSTTSRGEAGELRVIAHLREHGFGVERVKTLREQFEGIDLYATSPRTGERRRIEVKTDYRAQETGNAAIETVSNDQTGRQGWVHTTTADYLLYLIWGDDVLYWLEPWKMRAKLPGWEQRYRHSSTPNPGFRTLFVLVPLWELEELSTVVVSL